MHSFFASRWHRIGLLRAARGWGGRSALLPPAVVGFALVAGQASARAVDFPFTRVACGNGP